MPNVAFARRPAALPRKQIRLRLRTVAHSRVLVTVRGRGGTLFGRARLQADGNGAAGASVALSRWQGQRVLGIQAQAAFPHGNEIAAVRATRVHRLGRTALQTLRSR